MRGCLTPAGERAEPRSWPGWAEEAATVSRGGEMGDKLKRTGEWYLGRLVTSGRGPESDLHGGPTGRGAAPPARRGRASRPQQRPPRAFVPRAGSQRYCQGGVFPPPVHPLWLSPSSPPCRHLHSVCLGIFFPPRSHLVGAPPVRSSRGASRPARRRARHPSTGRTAVGGLMSSPRHVPPPPPAGRPRWCVPPARGGRSDGQAAGSCRPRATRRDGGSGALLPPPSPRFPRAAVSPSLQWKKKKRILWNACCRSLPTAWCARRHRQQVCQCRRAGKRQSRRRLVQAGEGGGGGGRAGRLVSDAANRRRQPPRRSSTATTGGRLSATAAGVLLFPAAAAAARLPADASKGRRPRSGARDGSRGGAYLPPPPAVARAHRPRWAAYRRRARTLDKRRPHPSGGTGGGGPRLRPGRWLRGQQPQDPGCRPASTGGSWRRTFHAWMGVDGPSLVPVFPCPAHAMEL